jgi:hypothetical protein
MSGPTSPSPTATSESSLSNLSELERVQLELLNLGAAHESLQADYNLLKNKLTAAEATIVAVVHQRDALQALQAHSTDLSSTSKNPQTSGTKLRRTIQTLKSKNSALQDQKNRLEDSLDMKKGINESLKGQIESIKKKKDQEIAELHMQFQVLTINYDQLAAEAGRKGKKKMFTMADLEKAMQETEGKDAGTAAVLTADVDTGSGADTNTNSTAECGSDAFVDIGSGADANTNSAAECGSDAFVDVSLDGDAEVKTDDDLLLDFAALFSLEISRPIRANTTAEENHAEAQITLVEPYDPSLLD